MTTKNSFLNLIDQINSYRIVKWFYTVLGGVSIDVVLFYLLSSQGVPAFWSNLISSGLAITFVYFTSVRFVFKNKDYAVSRYILFASYYAISISFFSYLISVLTNDFSFLPIIAKITTLPFSFIINYYFASKIV